FNLIKKEQVESFLKFYFIIAVLHSITNVLLFFGSMGEVRYFGLASLYYDDLTMLIIPVGLAYFLWAKSKGQSLFYGAGSFILILGLISTHSRAPLLTVVWVSIAMIIYSLIKAKRVNALYVRRRIKILLVSTLTIFSVLLIIFLPIFSSVIGRFEELSDFNTGTIRLRLILWNAAFISFSNNPLTGIGPGNFRYVGSIFPVLKYNPIFLHVSHLSAHNLVMHYLAENGLIGTIPLLALFYTYLRKSWSFVRGIGNDDSTPYLIGLFFTAVAISFSIFYLDGWLWGQNAYALPFFLALSARMVYNRKKDEK
ncbi:MAG: O-antigen ligase family protein, partial [Candidatus Zixiibacteriota bacterium]